eukprot:TRINITY_DN3567_c0_g1_i2.p1 TRINITY_DN3567_c0_g1~~TRINITY_DN3567_c0_g1_i2.p1  ORF type:complete len:283 (+),score=68.73 TRINITY_DN3567_c0_g1_i2:79-927(+)
MPMRTDSFEDIFDLIDTPSLPASQLERVFARKKHEVNVGRSEAARKIPSDEKEIVKSFDDCMMIEFVDVNVETKKPPQQSTAVQTSTDCCKMRVKEETEELQNKVRQLETTLEEWKKKEVEFKAKDAECARLRTILRFSQLKKDSDNMKAARCAASEMKKRLDNQQLKARFVEKQHEELVRLQQIEREYREMCRSDPRPPPAPGPPPAATAAAPSTAAPAEDVSFGTICGRIENWVQKRALLEQQQQQQQQQQKRPPKKIRVASAPPGGRRASFPRVSTPRI